MELRIGAKGVRVDLVNNNRPPSPLGISQVWETMGLWEGVVDLAETKDLAAVNRARDVRPNIHA